LSWIAIDNAMLVLGPNHTFSGGTGVLAV